MQTLRVFLITLVLAFSGVLPGCVSSLNKPQITSLQHELVGKIWDMRQQAFIDKAAVLEQLSSTEYLLLGEKHDNPVHHQHQTWFIQQLKSSQTQASVAFEMIDNYQGGRLTKQTIRSADQVIAILNQSKTNWKYKIRYRSLFSEAIAADYPIVAANLNRKRLMHTVMAGEDKLPDAYKRMLDEAQLSEAQLRNMQEEIKAVHCNSLSGSIIKEIVLGQRLRDAIMAHSLLRSQSPVKVLIAGAGHVRNDRGVPLYLGKNKKTLAVGFVEVEDGVNEVSAYAQQWRAKTPPFDIVWFTPPGDTQDLVQGEKCPK